MIAVVALVLVTAMLVAAIAVSATSTTQRTRERQDRVLGLTVSESAVAAFELALTSGRTSEQKGFHMSDVVLREVAPPNSQVLANSQLPDADMRQVDPSVPAWAQFTVVEPVDGSVNGYWQVYALAPPAVADDAFATVSVYFRAWLGDGTGVHPTRSRLVLARYRASLLIDYELVIDNQIRFTDGTTIEGAVHSNGYINEGYDTAGNNAHRIWYEGNVRCVGDTLITTAQGTVHMPNSCDEIQRDYPFVSFARIRRAISGLGDQCGATVGVRCFGERADGNDHTVQLTGGMATVDGVTFATGGTTLVLYGNAQVQGTASGRMSVAVLRQRNSTRADDGGNLTIVGDTRSGGGDGNGLGLYAQGNVIVDTSSCAVSTIDATIITPDGALTLDPALTGGRLQSKSGRPERPCPKLDVLGAIAARNAPYLEVQWEDGSSSGYTRRSYKWDDRVTKTAPPNFPMSDGFRLHSYRDANPDCLTSRRGDATCQ